MLSVRMTAFLTALLISPALSAPINVDASHIAAPIVQPVERDVASSEPPLLRLEKRIDEIAENLEMIKRKAPGSLYKNKRIAHESLSRDKREASPDDGELEQFSRRDAEPETDVQERDPGGGRTMY